MADEGVDLIVTSGGLGPTADDMTVATVARFCGRELALDAELENKIAEILKKLMARIGTGDFEAVRAANRKQAMVPVGAVVMDPVGTAPGVVVPGKPTVVVLPGPPRELQPMWKTAVQLPDVQEAIAGPDHLPPGHHQDVRAAGVRSGRDPARGRARRTRIRRAGDHHLPAPRRDRDGHPLRARRRRHLPPTDRTAPGPARAADLLRRRLPGRRSGRAAVDRAPDRDGGVVHRRTAGGTAHRTAGFVGVPGRGTGGLRQRCENRVARRRSGADRRARRGVRAGGRGDGRRCAAPLRRRHRGGDHRDRRARRRNRRQAGRAPSASPWRWPAARRRPGRFGCPATAPTSGSDRRRWRCICCVKRSVAPPNTVNMSGCPTCFGHLRWHGGIGRR